MESELLCPIFNTYRHVQVMSGQHVCATNNQANVYVEIEVIGVPADSFKDKTKVV